MRSLSSSFEPGRVIRHAGTRMKYLLDTNAVSDIGRNVLWVKRRFTLLDPKLIAVSTVSIKELQYGRVRNPHASRKFDAAIDELLAKVDVISFDVQDAYAAGSIRAWLARAGKPIGPYDLMIAGTALARGLILVTSNTREFCRVPNLVHEDWRIAPNMVRENVVMYRSRRRPLLRAGPRVSERTPPH